MAVALLFKPGPGAQPPSWLVCLDDCVDSYRDAGWLLLGRDLEISYVQRIESPPWQKRQSLWRPRRKGSTGE